MKTYTKFQKNIITIHSDAFKNPSVEVPIIESFVNFGSNQIFIRDAQRQKPTT